MQFMVLYMVALQENTRNDSHNVKCLEIVYYILRNFVGKCLKIYYHMAFFLNSEK